MHETLSPSAQAGFEPDASPQVVSYPYPYQPRDWEQQLSGFQAEYRANSPVADVLLTETNGAPDIFVAPGFDMQSAVSATQAPALEVGGPTLGGYRTLDGITFSDGLIISNVENPGWDTSGLHQRDIDARHLPFEDGSLGVVMAASLNKRSEDVHGKLSGDAGDAAYADEAVSALVEIAEQGSQAFIAGSSEVKRNPRIGLMAESARTLKPGGLLVMQYPTAEDILIATQLGFELKEHTMLVPPRQGWGAVNNVPGEVVFQKSHQSDDAGRQ